MKTSQELKKINPVYAVGFYAGCVALFVIIVSLLETVGSVVFAYLGLVPLALSIWGPTLFFKAKVKKAKEDLASAGFTVNYTFNGRTVNFYMDFTKGQMAFIYKYNPFVYTILPLSEAKNPRVNDFKAGKGFMEGSNMVALEFDVQGKRQRIHTFTSNKRFTMNSKEILDGISKADMMCERIMAFQKSV